MEGMHRALRFVFLKEGKDGVDKDHTEDRPAKGGHPFAGLHEFCGEREGGSHPEQNGKEVGELVEEPSNQRIVTRLDKNIRSVLSQSPLSVIGRQTTVGGFQALQHIFDRKLVNVEMAELRHGRLAR
jgi:hypothetical protein